MAWTQIPEKLQETLAEWSRRFEGGNEGWTMGFVMDSSRERVHVFGRAGEEIWYDAYLTVRKGTEELENLIRSFFLGMVGVSGEPLAPASDPPETPTHNPA